MSILLVIVITLLIVGSFPRWRHSSDWGYYPTSGLSLLLLVVVVLMLVGQI